MPKKKKNPPEETPTSTDITPDAVNDDDIEEVIVTGPDFDPDVEREEEYERLIDIFSELEGVSFRVAQTLCRQLAKLKVHMMLLEWQFDREGIIERMTQGPNTFNRQHPAYTTYLQTLKSYTNIYKQIKDLYPKDAAPTSEADDELMDWLQKGGR